MKGLVYVCAAFFGLVLSFFGLILAGSGGAKQMDSIGAALLVAYVVCWSLAAVMAKRDNVGIAALALFSPLFVVWIGVVIFAAVASVVAPVPNRPRQDAIADPFPAPQRVALEILHRRDFDPPRLIDNGRTLSPTYDWQGEFAKMHTRCEPYLHSSPDGTSVGFKQDVTGRKRAQGRPDICTPDGIWFVSYGASVPGHPWRRAVVLKKYSLSGDPVYSSAFEEPPGSGSIVDSTFSDSGGYLNFDWWNLHRTGETEGNNLFMSSYLKARIREPGNEGASGH